MSTVPNVTAQQSIKRIGIILGDLGKLDRSILQYLVLQINTLQHTFEFEFLPPNPEDEFLRRLSNRTTVNRNEIKEAAPAFLDRYRVYLEALIIRNELMDKELPRSLVVVSLARFHNNFYSARKRDISVLALGNWDRWMAPPSIIEFILTLVIREAIGFVCPSLRGSIHLGTKGCVCDFTFSLGDARIKALTGFICRDCRAKLEAQGLHTLAEELTPILGKAWLGTPDNAKMPAGVAAKLGYNLFLTKGVKPSFSEKAQEFLRQDLLKVILSAVIAVLQGILIAYLVLRFGLNGH